MMTKLPPPDGRDAALAWLYAMSQADVVKANDAKLEAKRAEINAAIDAANAKVAAATEEADRLIAEARQRAQQTEGLANDTAKRLTAEAIADRNAAAAAAKDAQAYADRLKKDQDKLDAALAEVRKAEDEAQARLASLKESQAAVEVLRARLQAMADAGEKAA